MNKIAEFLLLFLYGGALFAGFLSPYSPNQEFRDHFFHPPSRIHFRNSSGQFVSPYVESTWLVDSDKHIFAEGTPVWVVFSFPERNQNVYMAERFEQETPIATVKTDDGRLVADFFSLKETGENTGLFAGMIAINVLDMKSFVIESNGKRYVFPVRKTNQPAPPTTKIFLMDDSGKPATELAATQTKFRLSCFAHGPQYKLFGIFPCDIHLLGVEQPGHLFLLGTDQLGRDIFSRILYGGRISLTVGLIGVFLTTCLGWLIGGLAGYLGGRADTIFMRIAEVMMAVPALYLILAVRNVFPLPLSSEISYTLIVVVLSLTGWAVMARVIRGMVLSLREEQFVVAAKSQGASSLRILLRHILPGTAGYVIVRATLLVPSYILAEVTLSFLGVGIQEPAPSWGNMLTSAQDLRVLSQYSWVLAPGMFLFLTVLAFNFFGEGMRKRFSIRGL